MKGSSNTGIIVFCILILAVIGAFIYFIYLKYGNISQGLTNFFSFSGTVNQNNYTPDTSQPYQIAVVDSYGCDLTKFTCPADAEYCTYIFSEATGDQCPQSGRLEAGENYKTKTGCPYSSFSSKNLCRMLGNYVPEGYATTTLQNVVTTTITTTTVGNSTGETTTTTVAQTQENGNDLIYSSEAEVTICWFGGCNVIMDQANSPWCCPEGYVRCEVHYNGISRDVTPNSMIGKISSSRPDFCKIVGIKG